MRLLLVLGVLAWLLLGAGLLRAESLVTATNLSNGTMYSDQVARQVGDLITVLVNENTRVDESQDTETSRESTLGAVVRALPESSRTLASVGSSTEGTLPIFEAESEKEFTGEGSFSQSGRMTTRITGRVTDVLDNGNLVIEGRRQLTFGDNIKTIRLTGICRAADLNADNLVNSERLHNLQVAIEGEGPISRSQQEGILGRILDIIWPL